MTKIINPLGRTMQRRDFLKVAGASVAVAALPAFPALSQDKVKLVLWSWLPDFQAQAWNAIFAPKGTSPEIVAKLNAAVVKALDDETVRKRLLDLGSVIPPTAERTPAALAALVKSEVAKWTAVVKPVAN